VVCVRVDETRSTPAYCSYELHAENVMKHRLLESSGVAVMAALVAALVAACAAAGNLDNLNTEECIGQTIEGPWFRFLLPDGMIVDNVENGRINESSVWIRSNLTAATNAFFLFAPRHGGIAYPIFLDADNVRKLVEFDTENGETLKYVITYEDGSIGLYEGDSQRITGLRVGDSPLGQQEFERYKCFLDSIEQYAE